MGEDGARRDALLRGVATACAVLAVALSATTLVLFAWLRSRGVDAEAPLAGDLVVGTLFPLAGLLVLRKQPRNSSGWVLLSCTTVAVSSLAHLWASAGGVADPGSLPLVPVAVWLSAWTFVSYWAQPVLLPLLFPDGRLTSPRWRRFARAVVVLLVLLALSAALAPNDSVSGMGLANPLGLHALPRPLGWAVIGVQIGSGLLLWLVCAPVALWSLVVRQRAATGRERAQLQWLLLGFVGLLVLTVAGWPLSGGLGEAVFAAGFACVPAALAVAVLRHGMLDVEVVVNRTIVYGLLTAGSLATYLGVVAVAGRWLGGDGAAPLVAGLVVAAAATGRSALQRLVDRRLFGARSDPYALVRSVGASTAAAVGPDAALDALARAVREELRLPFVQVLDDRGEPAAAVGEPVAGTHVVPVVDRGREVGVLVLGRRSKRERLRAEELGALREVAHRAGTLLSARRLAVELQRSYAELVRVREEERRRLRRELHDGVGPALAGTALQLDSLAGRLQDAPELAERAERLRDRLQDTVGEVRRMVDGLRPAVLDELGLPAALQALGTEADDPVHVRVLADLPRQLPAGVEAAAYRIAGEAVTNALRHAGAARVDVRAELGDDGLLLEVGDDGDGFGADATAGVGLRSMHDRAGEVGGRLEVDSAPGRGTVVRAVLPVQMPA